MRGLYRAVSDSVRAIDTADATAMQRDRWKLDATETLPIQGTTDAAHVSVSANKRNTRLMAGALGFFGGNNDRRLCLRDAN